MRTSFLCFALLFFSFLSKGQNLVNNMDSVSYSIGVLVAQNLKSQGLDKVDENSFMKALTDVMEDKALAIPVNECQVTFQKYMEEAQSKKYAGNKEAGEKFLVENAKRPEVKTTPSGLQYEIIKAGTGTKPTSSSKVTVHYHGMLIDGTVFDSSVDRGQPASFPVNGVIQGWQEALPMMEIGAKWKLFIPSNLAYGERGAGGQIGPFSALVFDVELISID